MAEQIIGTFLAVCCFSILIETPGKYLWFAGVVGAIGEIMYLCVLKSEMDLVFASFLSALTVAFLSHIFARIFKAPVTVFLIAGILPTVPGAGMYRFVAHILAKENSLALMDLTQTLEIAGVIALAIFITDAVFHLGKKIKSAFP